jgi:hypothetical protein
LLQLIFAYNDRSCLVQTDRSLLCYDDPNTDGNQQAGIVAKVDFSIAGTAEVAEFSAEFGRFCARMQSEQVACWNGTLAPALVNLGGTRKIQTFGLGYGGMSGSIGTVVATAFSDGYTTIGLNFAPRVVVAGSMTDDGTGIYLLDNGDLYSYGSGAAKGVAQSNTANMGGYYMSRIDLGQNRTVISASCGNQHCCAIDITGQVRLIRLYSHLKVETPSLLWKCLQSGTTFVNSSPKATHSVLCCDFTEG